MRYLRWTGFLAAAAVAASACVMEEDGGKKKKGGTIQSLVGFEDIALESCVREHLGIFEGQLQPADLERVVHLECQDRGITSIKGLNNLKSLATLSLWENEIDDLSPLAELTGLTELQLGNNLISDLTPLSGLTALQRLGLSINDIVDLTPLSGLTEIRFLNVDLNHLVDITPIAALPYLEWLTVDHNPLGADNPVVNDLRNNKGVDVYADYTDEAPVGKTHPGLPDLGNYAAVGHELVRASELLGEITADGTVKLSVISGGHRYPLITEFGNRLFDDQGVIFYRAPEGSVAVGAWTSDGPQICKGDYADVCSFSIGAKAAPHELSPQARSSAPVFTAALTLTAHNPLDRYRDGEVEYGQINTAIMDYVLATPNQYDAGSCVFMATTGAMEVLMNQHVPFESIQYGGDTDLSERYLMTSFDNVPMTNMRYWLLDLLYAYNFNGGSLLDRDFPFMMGCQTASGQPVSCSSASAEYLDAAHPNWPPSNGGSSVLPDNWQDMLVTTPPGQRTSLYTHERDDEAIWRVAVMDDSVIDKIKYSLRTQKAPVLIIFNYYLYWHANMIVGYDDTATLGGCPMVESSISYFRQQGRDMYANKIEARMEENGGCWDNGVFYVRDSIYDGGADEEIYNYGGDADRSDKYSKRIKEHSYNWVRYLANHAFVIYRGR